MGSSAIGTPTFQAKTSNILNVSQQSLALILDATPTIVFRPDFNREDAVIGKAVNHCVLFKDFATGASTTLADHIKVGIKSGTIIRIGETFRSFVADTLTSWVDSSGAAVTATAGKDYAVYIKVDGNTYITDVTDGAFPVQRESTSGQLASLVGGFHVGHVAHTAAIASGAVAFSTTNNVDPDGGGALAASSGMVWSNTMLNKIKMVNAYSLWDMGFMPKNREPRGMAFNGSKWIGIYMLNANCGTSGNNFRRLSRYESGLKLASGESATTIPTDPITGSDFPNFNWWSAAEILNQLGGNLMDEALFTSAAQGVLEATALGGAAVTPTLNEVIDNRFTSWLGLHGMTGCMWSWGSDSLLRSTTGTDSWKGNDLTGLRGQQYMVWDDSLARVMLGGDRGSGSNCGSRCSYWYYYPRASSWSRGTRAACDHL